MRTFTFLGPNITSLTANMGGSTTMSDNSQISTWFFGNGFNDDRSVPCPVIEAIEGQAVEVTLSSSLPHSIHFHGLDVDQANDGVPSTSGYVAVTSNQNFGRVQGYTNLGSPFTYTFTAPHAGTYMYHCHIDTALHLEMGMIGTVIVRPPNGSITTAWTGGPTFDKEYIWHLHTYDSSWHNEFISSSATARYTPDYFLLNGSEGNQCLTDPTCTISGDSGTKVLIRATNVGYQHAVVDLGGLPFEIIASDGRPIGTPVTVTEQLITPGERYDMLVTIPLGYDELATISYWDIRLKTILGTAQTTVKDTSDDLIFSDSFEPGA